MTSNLVASVSELRRTADLLEIGAQAAPIDPTASVVTVSERPEPSPPHQRSQARFVARTLVHTAVTASLLTGVCLVVDPLLPHGERPELSGPIEPSTTAPSDLLASPNTP